MLASVQRTAALPSLFARFRTLKFSLLFATGCLAAILIADLGQDGVEAWKKFQYAKNLRAADLAGNNLVNVIYSLLREQPLVNGASRSSAAASPASLQRFDSYYKSANDSFNSSLAGILAIAVPNRQAIADALSTAYRSADAVRTRARAMIAVPPAARDQTVLAEYNTAMTDLIKTVQKLWTTVSYIEIQSEPTLTRYSRIKSISWRLREIAGNERAAVTAAILTSEPITEQGNLDIENARAQIQLGWHLIVELVGADSASSPIKAAVDKAERDYFEDFKPLVDRMRQLSEAKAAYPLSLNQWLAQTNPSIDSFLNILNAAAAEGEKRSAALEADAFLDLILRITGVLIAIAGSLICFFVEGRRVADPLARLSEAVRGLASGQFDVKVADTERNDEIGEVARAVDFFKANLIQTRSMAAARDAERAAKEERAAVLENLAKVFETKFAGVAQSFDVSATQLEETSRSLSICAEQTNQQSNNVATTARRTSENVQAVAAAGGQLAHSAQEIGNSVSHASRITRSAVDHSRHADATIQALATAADQIGEVVKLINDVAEQTNLLALNATIEAARAGESGRGFAVVAAEVKLLAGQTAKATQEIDQQIAQIQGATSGTIAAIRNMDAAIVEVDHIAVAVAEAVSLQHAATQEIADKIDETAAGANDMTQRIADVQQAAKRTGQVANELLASASEVTRSSSLLRREVEAFLSGVRQAS
jgi:methyl-accepting chemotaxis protein